MSSRRVAGAPRRGPPAALGSGGSLAVVGVRTAADLRRAFTEFFAARGHTILPSASLIPHDPTVLFTVAGMVPFKPYFTGDQTPPYKRAATVQKCVRAGGKHNDLEEVGRTNRHLTFFEMLGNFSFGDYFKADAIPWAWELVTTVFGLDPERLWVTVHVTDDEAEAIWRDVVGFPAERIQRLGDETNLWSMGETGPSGYNSEIFLDLTPELGPGGGPAVDEDRYVELWNLVFMQFDQRADGIVPLPAPSVDTGAGFERCLAILQGVDTVWDTDIIRPLIAAAERVTGISYGGFPGSDRDVSLRILAEHGRTITFLIADDVVPSNEERGYVLRRIIRRAVRHAYLLGVHDLVTPAMVDATVEVMGEAYPELRASHERIRGVVRREEERFRSTLERGLELLDDVLARGDVTGDDAFYLHDTLGFPIDLTREIAAERGRTVDNDGFQVRMKRQRDQARDAHKAEGVKLAAPVEVYRELLDDHGATEFTGRQEYETTGAKVLGLLTGGERVMRAGAGSSVDVFVDRTPFYAEAGGQVGDTGTIETAGGALLRITDTQFALPGLVAHRAEVVGGEIVEGDAATARIDAERRDAIRRNHTATHVLHWALREVLGPHVKQAGSLVAPDRLRFDFSHHEAVSREQLDEVEQLANREVIGDAPVRHYETTREHAQELGAIAFFGEKYGDIVRVLEAGEHSIELCGGTHVHALGFIGPIKIVSEGSIGSNLRRIEAVTGTGALDRIHEEEVELRAVADLLRAQPSEVADRIRVLQAELRERNDELKALRARQVAGEAIELAARARDGVVVSRRDGAGSDELQRLAQAVRDALESGVVVLAGAGADGKNAGIAVGVTKDLVARGLSAADIAQPAAKVLGGGTARKPDLVVGGGPNVAAVGEALDVAAAKAREAVASAE
jgi:alanyl-tRNA synthetase